MTTMQIPLYGGRFALIDEEDYPLVCQFKWSCAVAGGRPYARTQVNMPGGGHRNYGMHRIIMLAARGEQIDHINMNTLDNRRCNLRRATKAQNMQNRQRTKKNTSGFKGVRWHRGAGKWMAEIKSHGVREYLGLFLTAEEAARAYDTAALRLHGKYARPNFSGDCVQLVTTPAEAA